MHQFRLKGICDGSLEYTLLQPPYSYLNIRDDFKLHIPALNPVCGSNRVATANDLRSQ